MSILRRQPFPLWSLCGLVVLLSTGLLGGRLLPLPGTVGGGEAGGKFYKVISAVTREAEGILREFSLGRLDRTRRLSVYTGGHSLFDPGINLNRLADVLRYLPRGLAHTLFAPFPWQWSDTQGSTGLFNSAAAIEVISVYLLFPVALRGMVWLVCRRRGDALVIVVFTVVTAVLLSLTIANGGTLFRLRMQCLLPLLVITSIGGSRAAHPEMGVREQFCC